MSISFSGIGRFGSKFAPFLGIWVGGGSPETVVGGRRIAVGRERRRQVRPHAKTRSSEEGQGHSHCGGRRGPRRRARALSLRRAQRAAEEGKGTLARKRRGPRRRARALSRGDAEAQRRATARRGTVPAPYGPSGGRWSHRDREADMGQEPRHTPQYLWYNRTNMADSVLADPLGRVCARRSHLDEAHPRGASRHGWRQGVR